MHTDGDRETIGFLKEEVATMCGALALGASLLRHRGLEVEATRLEGLFRRVEQRLGPAQPEAPTASPPCSVSGS
jgi:hypothetical protein